MVSKPLLWPFLSSLVFISVTLFSTSLLPSQQPLQPFAVEPLMSSSHRPWVPDLQLPSLRSFTLHRPLPFASPLQILLQFRFWRYHRDRLALIYILMKASTSSETARTPTRRSKALFRWSRAPHASTQHWFSSRTPTHRHAPQPSRWRHCWRHPRQPLLAPLLMSLAYISRWRHPLTLGVWSLTFSRLTVDFDCWLFSMVDFFSLGSSYPIFHVDFIFAVCFCILCL